MWSINMWSVINIIINFVIINMIVINFITNIVKSMPTGIAIPNGCGHQRCIHGKLVIMAKFEEKEAKK